MHLEGKQKNQVKLANNKDEAKDLNDQAGIALKTDEELESVTGGDDFSALYFINESKMPLQQTENDSVFDDKWEED